MSRSRRERGGFERGFDWAMVCLDAYLDRLLEGRNENDVWVCVEMEISRLD